MKYITAPVLWFLFVLATIAGFITGLIALPFGERGRRYAADNFHSQDRAAAAFLGWSGDNTVSKECGRELAAGRPCRFCRALCRLLDIFLETDHCKKEGNK